ncbi:hypothetical protein [Brooklawnia cerclae]|uniref:Uncharacterized protein n=3 Tax=Brooklawnia cerclae TaxID=349934 RepID=A0ABX0SFX1_9ACTN|nr:hypothetical protein [Brooklawnia cerclae]NIH57290.1 hypothetical protein [Brooklawnia cerclae]
MTTTIIPAQQETINYTATLLSPFHHGAGNSGNTALLRTQDVAQPDGTVAQVPFLSAASIRHALRDRIAWHLVSTLDLRPPAVVWSKLGVDLLWTGGSVTSTGAEVDLGMARRVEEVFPALALFGYSAHSDIVSGTLRASDAILVCRENQWRIPGAPDTKPAAAWRGEEFGTRHDVASTPVATLLEQADTLLGSTVKTTQMIFDTQVLIAGASLSGQLALQHGATAAHRTVLGAALALWAPGGEALLGAKTAQGYGRAAIAGLPDTSADLAAWTAHIADRRDDILQLVEDLTR